jgi:perosamine synthetase
VGATPVFADIDPTTWCVSAETVKPLITSKTKAIIAVNLYGHMPEYDALLGLGIPVIEDAAESIGSLYKGKKSGTFGITSCFSFHGSKTLTTGEGGMLVTDDENIYERCMIIRDHGRLPGDTLFQNIEVGHKYKMSNLQAALGLAQLERLDDLVQKKREIFSWYQEALTNVGHFSLNPDHPDVYNSYWMTTILWDAALSLTKFDMVQKLKAKDIASRPFFSPLSSLKAYEGAQDTARAQAMNRVASDICTHGVNLPCGGELTEEKVQRIAKNLKGILND